MRKSVFFLLAFAHCSTAVRVGVGVSDDKDASFDDAPSIKDPDASLLGCFPDPAKFDVPGNNCDDDGDGTVDNTLHCDTGLALTGDAAAFARAIGLCQTATATRWGIVSAVYTQGNTMEPDPVQHGILAKFGDVVVPREAAMLGVLSTGYAREFDECDPELTFRWGCEMTGLGTAPLGFPVSAAGCPAQGSVNDVSTVKLTIKAPTNAVGFAFDFDFFSGEWPEWVCNANNDSFVAYVTSKAIASGHDNVSFDGLKNPVGVNSVFFDNCSPANANVACFSGTPKTTPCAGGDAELRGTGFYAPNGSGMCGQTDSGGGSTGWLTTTSPIVPGETFTIDLMIWDGGDQDWDSSVLVDNFLWNAGYVPIGTTRPPH